MSNEIVTYRPAGRRNNTALQLIGGAARAVGPSVVRSITNNVLNRVASSLPTPEGVGRMAGDAYNGFYSKKSGGGSLRGGGGGISAPNHGDISYAPVTIGTRSVTRRAKISTGKGRGKATTITHRELIKESLVGSMAYVTQVTLPLNPGMPSTFPWLSTQASQYEEYRFRKLEFEYVPIVSTATQGDIMLVPDYDSSNPPPVGETQAMDHYGSVMNSCWRPTNIKLSIADMFALGSRKYVRSSSMFGDIKTFDCGNLFVGTDNQAADGTKIGKLFVSYTVDLYTPSNGPAAYTTAGGTSAFGNPSIQTLTTGNPLTFNFSSTWCNALGCKAKWGTGTYADSGIDLPAGFYKLEYSTQVQDSVSEAFTGQAYLSFGGVAINTGSVANSKEAGVANNMMVLSGVAFLSVPPSGASLTNLNLVVTAIGASGVLTIQANNSYLTIQLA